jgi:hypothetical protein
MLAPQKKATMVMPNGTTDQNVSRKNDPSRECVGSLSSVGQTPGRRRKRIMNVMIRPAMSSEKKAVTPRRKKKSVSTWPAMVDA